MTASGGFDIRILGPVRALRDGEELALGGNRARLFLAVLATQPGDGASRSAIAEALWDDRPPAGADNAIQVQVSRLRAVLGADAIRTTPAGYRLAANVSVDAARFADQRRAAQRAGDLRESARLYRLALAEWTGRALDDLRGNRFADDVAATLEERRLATLENCLDVELALGRHADIVPELHTLTRDHPLREAMWSRYLIALYRAGRQADALEAYRTLRRTLADELGIEPQPELRALEKRILDHDPSLDTPAAPSPIADGLFAPTVPGTLAPDVPRAVLRGPEHDVEVDGFGLRIGRLPENTLVIDDPKASRYHATISWRDGRYVLTDLNTTNGTTVNGRRIHEHVLADDDVIAIGKVTFRFVLPGGPGSGTVRSG